MLFGEKVLPSAENYIIVRNLSQFPVNKKPIIFKFFDERTRKDSPKVVVSCKTSGISCSDFYGKKN